MGIRAKHMMMLVILAAMLVVVGLWSAGASLARAGDDHDPTGRTTSAESSATVPPLTIPSMDDLRARADYVSPDGREVRIGDVGISAAPVVSRSPLE